MIYKFLLGLDFSLMSVIMWRPPVFFCVYCSLVVIFLRAYVTSFCHLKIYANISFHISAYVSILWWRCNLNLWLGNVCYLKGNSWSDGRFLTAPWSTTPSGDSPGHFLVARDVPCSLRRFSRRSPGHEQLMRIPSTERREDLPRRLPLLQLRSRPKRQASLALIPTSAFAVL